MSFASVWLLNEFPDSFSRGAEPGVCVVKMKSEREASCHINIFNIPSCCLQRHFLYEVCYTKKLLDTIFFQKLSVFSSDLI